jgi:hypothetical protein
MQNAKSAFDEAVSAGDADRAAQVGCNVILHEETDLEILYETGLSLWRIGRSHHARFLLTKAFELGNRHSKFLSDYFGLLTGESAYIELFAAEEALLLEGRELGEYLDMLVGHARLAQHYNKPEIIARAGDREEQPRWLQPEDLIISITAHLQEKKAFSFVRLGDGEARFHLYCQALFYDEYLIEKKYTRIFANIMWRNWFGHDVTDVSDAELKLLHGHYKSAVKNATVLGIVGKSRMASDTAHFGYMAHQDRYIDNTSGKQQLLADSLSHYQINEASPFFERIISVASRLSVVSPHRDLGAILGNRFKINEVCAYIVPGERRLPDELIWSAKAHYPEVYNELCRDLHVREPGELFLVAAGLLGKIYCEVIRSRGGIAVDIGSLADGWMGFNTRPGMLDAIEKL